MGYDIKFVFVIFIIKLPLKENRTNINDFEMLLIESQNYFYRKRKNVWDS